MNTNAVVDSPRNTTLPPELVEKVLSKLGFSRPPEPTFDGLRNVYSAWCAQVPFDNVRKLIHVRAGSPGPLPGSNPEEFLAAWLKFGTGGTCWSGAGGLHALLSALGFNAARGIATMLAAPDLPPNHGTVLVSFDNDKYLVDTSILHGEPLRYETGLDSAVEHPAWGARSLWKGGKWHVAWRPLHKTDGFECRFEQFGAEADEFPSRYEQTRGWSPFNCETVARSNRNGEVVGLAFGHAVSLRGDGTVDRRPISHEERNRILIEDLNYSEEIVRQLPQDIPTPPPPGSRTAQQGAAT